MALQDAGVRISGKDETAAAFKSVQQNMRNMASAAAVMEGPLGQVAGRMNSIGAALGRVNPATLAATVGMAGFISIQRLALPVAAEFEQQMFRLEKQLEITGSRSGFTANQLNILAKDIGRVTLASQQGARDAASALLGFETILGPQFETVLRLAQDVAAVFGGDIRTNTMKLARALENPREGLQLLNRNILISTAEWREHVVGLHDAGNVMEAQTLIIDKLAEKLGGAGAAEGQGLAGSLDGLSESWTDFLTAVAADQTFDTFVRLLTDALDKLAFALESDPVRDTINGYKEWSEKLVEAEINVQRLEGRVSTASGRNVASIRKQLEVAEEERDSIQKTVDTYRLAIKTIKDNERAASNAAKATASRIEWEKRLDKSLKDAIAVHDEHEREIQKGFKERAAELKKLEAAYESLWKRTLSPEDKLGETFRADAQIAVTALQERLSKETQMISSRTQVEMNMIDARTDHAVEKLQEQGAREEAILETRLNNEIQKLIDQGATKDQIAQARLDKEAELNAQREAIQDQIDAARLEKETVIDSLREEMQIATGERRVEIQRQITDMLLALEGDYRNKLAELQGGNDLDKFEEGLLTKEERMVSHYENQLFQLNNFLDEGRISYETYFNWLSAIEDKEAKRRIKIEEEAHNKIIDFKRSVVVSGEQFLRLFAEKSRLAAITAIAINKALAIGQAIQNTGVAVTKALSVDPTGALAANVAAWGKAQIALIAATGLAEAASLGGDSGGSVPSPVSSTSTTDSIPEPIDENRQQVDVNIIIEGNVLAGDLAGIIADGLTEADLDDRLQLQTENGQRINVVRS